MGDNRILYWIAAVSVANSEGEALAGWMGPHQRGCSDDACATTQMWLRYELVWILTLSWAKQRGTLIKHRRLNSERGAGAAQSVWVLYQHALRWMFGSAKASSWFNWMFFAVFSSISLRKNLKFSDSSQQFFLAKKLLPRYMVVLAQVYVHFWQWVW